MDESVDRMLDALETKLEETKESQDIAKTDFKEGMILALEHAVWVIKFWGGKF